MLIGNSGGLIGAGVLANLSGAHGIAGWRWLFIICGVITICVALIGALVLPDFPATAKWLSDEERQFAQWRLVDDAKDNDDADAVSLLTGLKMALGDYRLYIFILFQHVSLLTQTFQYFFPSIVNTLGYNSTITLLLTVPVWFATLLVSLLVTWTSGRTGDRSIHIICLMCISCIGNIIVVSTTATGPRFFAMFLMPLGSVTAYQLILTWVANSFFRPLVKRSASIAMCNLIGSMSSIYGSYMYPIGDAPRYLAGGGGVAGLCLFVAIIAFVIRLMLIRENKKLERAEADGHGSSGVGGIQSSFRYII
jgi:hypothetical protein